MYKIIIFQTGSFDSNKSVIERRYSDFEKLHRNLLEEFSEEMEDVTFPKKTLSGNFTEEIINERKLAFKGYLRLLSSGSIWLPAGWPVHQTRLTRGNPVSIVPTLCDIVVCHKDLENPESTFEYGEKALSCLCMHTSHKYYMPLLETMITLAYELGKDFLSLQEKLEEWKEKRSHLGPLLSTQPHTKKKIRGRKHLQSDTWEEHQELDEPIRTLTETRDCLVQEGFYQSKGV
uniref:PX domain-containing protein n=1 Tax=Strigops habroptila TaxID=2489341 RepID=A0A672UAZ9_STRHB